MKNNLIKLNINHFDEVFSIMSQSFPLDEYRTYDEQKTLMKNPIYSIYGYFDENELKGFAAIYNFNEFIFIEHLAVSIKYRNQGIGEFILNQLHQQYSQMICLEVEPPLNELSKRRIDFYKRNQFYLNEYEYIQPSISKGKKPIPLYIMTSFSKIDENTFNKIRNVLYKQVYNI